MDSGRCAGPRWPRVRVRFAARWGRGCRWPWGARLVRRWGAVMAGERDARTLGSRVLFARVWLGRGPGGTNHQAGFSRAVGVRMDAAHPLGLPSGHEGVIPTYVGGRAVISTGGPMRSVRRSWGQRMGMRTKTAIWGASLGFVFSTGVTAQETGSIRGRVTDEGSGAPVGGDTCRARARGHDFHAGDRTLSARR